MTIIIIACLIACIVCAIIGINFAMRGYHTRACALICFALGVGIIPFFIVIEAMHQ